MYFTIIKRKQKRWLVKLQQYINQELPDVPAGFRKGGGIRDQIAIAFGS